MGNDQALLREVLPGGMMTTLPAGVATAFGAVLELLRRDCDPSLSPKGLVTGYYTGLRAIVQISIVNGAPRALYRRGAYATIRFASQVRL